MSEIKLDEGVIRNTRDALDVVVTDMPGLLKRAADLDVSADVNALSTLEAWANETSTDLSARLGLIEKLKQGDYHFEGFDVTRPQLRQMAGASMPVDEQLYTLSAVELAPGGGGGGAGDDGEILAWDGAQSFDDWIEQVEIKAAKHLPLIGPHAESVVSIFNDFNSLVTTGGYVATAVTMGRQPFKDKLMVSVLSRLQSSPAVQSALRGTWVDDGLTAFKGWLNRPRPHLAPVSGARIGTLRGQIYNRILAEGSFTESLARLQTNPRLATLLADNPILRTSFDRLSALAQSPQWAKYTRWGSNVMGRPWTTTVIENGVLREVTYARNGSNLLRVAATTEGGIAAKGLQTLKIAGGLRVLGIAGGALATIDSGVGVYNSWRSGEMADSWNNGGTQGKAKVIGDFAEVGFNASLTAAMVAPNPVTWGAVAVTGVVYGGARLVEHWDDVTHALGEAKDWAGDRVDDALDAVGDVKDSVEDFAGDAVDAVKHSKLNPGNWF